MPHHRQSDAATGTAQCILMCEKPANIICASPTHDRFQNRILTVLNTLQQYQMAPQNLFSLSHTLTNTHTHEAKPYLVTWFKAGGIF